MKRIVFISILASTLFAEQKHEVTDFFIDKDVKKVTHESGYGKCNTYSLLFAKHQIASDEQDLHFFYGAKMGLVQEDYSTENGFGIPLNKVGAYYAAAVGMQYDMSKTSLLLAEGSRSEDHANSRSESKLQLTYNYNY